MERVKQGERILGERVALALPRFAVIYSTYTSYSSRTYLRFLDEDGQNHGYLQFSGKEIVSPYVKFEIERAKSNNGFVHIRCCYNNKYWVAKSSSDSSLLAGADEPEEDQSKWSCTLFEPIPVDGGGGGADEPEEDQSKWSCTLLEPIPVDGGEGGSTNTTTSVQLRHAQLVGPGMATNASTRSIWANAPVGSLLVLPRSVTNPDVFSIVDWESLLILPQHIAFKGDNDLYLSARWIEGHQYLQFASSDYGDPTVGNETFISNDGSVRIKNNHFGKFWRRSPNWIWADSDGSATNNSDTLFSPVKVGDNIVALRNLGNNNFCKRLTTVGKTSCLSAADTTISTFARLVVEELVISREIYNVNFRLLDARIYNQNIITFASSSAENNKQVSDTKTLGFSHKDSRSSTWTGSVSLKLGVTTKIQTGIPFVAKGQVEISTEFTGGYEWGETVTTENEVRTEYTTTVPPMSKVTAWLRNGVKISLGISPSNEQGKAPQATPPPSLAVDTSESTVKQSKKKNENKKPDESRNEPTVSEQSSLALLTFKILAMISMFRFRNKSRNCN
ncbi:hypothetical protein RHMOL_Rhmol07G0029600 [Rhododendron molle]|uniref:Uncharacterized protein n=1 Tax=Rhododendron molle TaxID=49168 RepID=A0ACC0MW64_RHOML|nr:hypothetical protein RHMOL_Rhmol07G0029600 [Rhododendron molle]